MGLRRGGDDGSCEARDAAAGGDCEHSAVSRGRTSSSWCMSGRDTAQLRSSCRDSETGVYYTDRTILSRASVKGCEFLGPAIGLVVMVIFLSAARLRAGFFRSVSLSLWARLRMYLLGYSPPPPEQLVVDGADDFDGFLGDDAIVRSENIARYLCMAIRAREAAEGVGAGLGSPSFR